MNWTKPVALAVLAVTASPLAIAHFTRDVPAVIPSVEGWTRVTGDLEFERPHIAVRYEFFINPARPVIYEIVRYRVTELGPRGSAESRGNEKLQWDRDGRDLRRFECVAGKTADAACAWREMDKKGAEYRGEVPLLLRIYDAHNRKAREAN